MTSTESSIGPGIFRGCVQGNAACFNNLPKAVSIILACQSQEGAAPKRIIAVATGCPPGRGSRRATMESEATTHHFLATGDFHVA